MGKLEKSKLPIIAVSVAIIAIIAVAAIFVIPKGEVPTGAITLVCNKPYIQVGDKCCLDNNSNNICDNDETQPTIETKACPASCDDGLSYTKDYCSADTNYECKHETIKNICGNQICEADNKENTFTCSVDCQRKACTESAQCDDKDPCTKDTCTQGFCYNVLVTQGPCKISQTSYFTGVPGAGVNMTNFNIERQWNGSVYAYGELKNYDTVSFENVRVRVQTYAFEEDDYGNKNKIMTANKSGRIPYERLGSGEVAPFRIYIGNDIKFDGGKEYKIIGYKTSSINPYTDIAVDSPQCQLKTSKELEPVPTVTNIGTKKAVFVQIYLPASSGPIQEIKSLMPKDSVVIKGMGCGGYKLYAHTDYAGE